jgi:hypothetical protein
MTMNIRNLSVGFSFILACSLGACASPTVDDDSSADLANQKDAPQLGVTSSAIVTSCPLNGATSITLKNLDSSRSVTFKVTDGAGSRSISVGIAKTVTAFVSGSSVSVDVPLARGYDNTSTCNPLFFVGGSTYSGR